MMVRAPARLVPLIRLIAAAGLIASAGPGLARAAESEAVTSSRVTATIISDTAAVQPGRPFRLALRLRVASGWHTYWRNPGDAGAAPDIDWTLPHGLAAGPIAWAAPDRMEEGPLTTFGYTGDVVLPAVVSPVPTSTLSLAARLDESVPVAIRAHASWLVCAKICVPEEGDFQLSLPVGTATASAEAALFARADERVPARLPWTATIAPDGTLSLTGPELSPRVVRSASFIPGGWGMVTPASPPARIGDGVLSIALTPGPDFKPGAPLDGVLTVTDASGLTSHYAVTAEPGPAPGATESAAPGAGGIARALGLAFLGGLILNLMPCVFPILAMKAMALARLGGGHRHEARLHGVSYAAGVLVCFAALGGLLVALRAGGQTAGWGFQFQSPAFVAAMTWVMLAVGLNFSGVFAVGGGAGVAGAGGRLVAGGGLAGSFFTGLLAVLVATPCTAPYMAVAVATALASPPAATLAVFLALGAGLAAPFVALSGLPGLARILPRPGRWMEVLRQALAFPMYAAAAWLLWVVSQEAGPDAVLATAGGAVLVGLAAWTVRLSSEVSRRVRPVPLAAAGLSLVAMAALLGGGIGGGEAGGAATNRATAADAGAEPFSAKRLAALRAEGRPVFVNMTAAWCVTCLVNERVALGRDAVRHAFAERGVAYLKGDWTRQDPDISAFLHARGRDGVPLYVYFPGTGRAPAILPQILTPDDVLTAIAAG